MNNITSSAAFGVYRCWKAFLLWRDIGDKIDRYISCPVFSPCEATKGAGGWRNYLNELDARGAFTRASYRAFHLSIHHWIAWYSWLWAYLAYWGSTFIWGVVISFFITIFNLSFPLASYSNAGSLSVVTLFDIACWCLSLSWLEADVNDLFWSFFVLFWRCFFGLALEFPGLRFAVCLRAIYEP